MTTEGGELRETPPWKVGAVSLGVARPRTVSDDDALAPHEHQDNRSAKDQQEACVDGCDRYHYYRDGKYPIPNDDIEQNREDMKHAMVLELTDGKLVHAPIGDNPQKVIDLGTGTGE
jgi:hypothetical protein